jgi:hypothetical protein
MQRVSSKVREAKLFIELKDKSKYLRQFGGRRSLDGR